MKRAVVILRLHALILICRFRVRLTAMRALAGNTLAETAESAGLDATLRLPAYSYQNRWHQALRDHERALTHARRRLYNIRRTA